MSEIYHSTKHQMQQNQKETHLQSSEPPVQLSKLKNNYQQTQILHTHDQLQHPSSTLAIPQPVQLLDKCIHVSVIQIPPNAEKSSPVLPMTPFSESPVVMDSTSYDISKDIQQQCSTIIEISDDRSDSIIVNETPSPAVCPDIIRVEKNKKTVGLSDHGDKEKDGIPLKDHILCPNSVHLNKFDHSQPKLPSYEESRKISGPYGYWYIKHHLPTQPYNNYDYKTHPLSGDSSLHADASAISEQQAEVRKILEYNKNTVMHQNNYDSLDEPSRKTIYGNQLQNYEISPLSAMNNEAIGPMRSKKKTASKTVRSPHTFPEQDNTEFPCTLCPKKYDRKRSLASHMKIHTRKPKGRPIDEEKST